MVEMGEQLKRLRKGKGLTQIELSKRSGISQPQISEIEKGKSLPKIGIISKLADALDISVAVLDKRYSSFLKASDEQKSNQEENSPPPCPYPNCPLKGDLGKEKKELLEWLYHDENRLKLRELQLEMEQSKKQNKEGGAGLEQATAS